MNYRHIYMCIIMHAKASNRKRGDGNYYENHHILPKSLFPLWEKRKSNQVLLTAREHFFCHQLLTKIYPSKEMRYALCAFLMKNDKHKRVITSYEYERLRILNGKNASERMKGCHLSDETKLKISAAHKGKPSWNKGIPLSDEAKKKISETKRQNPHIWTEEERKAQSERNKKFGFFKTHKFIGKENGFYGKHHKKETIDKMKKKLSNKFSGSGNPCFGRKWYHNPATMEKIYLKPNDAIPEGYIPGTGVNYHKKKS